MKKLVFTLAAAFGLMAITTHVQAQKIGVFSSEEVIQALPEHAQVQQKLESYQRDSLGKAYDELQVKYEQAQKTYREDSIAKKPKAILDLDDKNRRELATQLLYWQQIAQQQSQMKYMELSEPLAEKVQKALQKVQKAQGVTVVFRPEVFDQLADQSGIVNLIIPVAKELGIKVDETPQAGAAN